MTTLQQRLQAALPIAMKARDQPAVRALRSALAAIENAAAVPPGDSLGATEVPRREQDAAEVDRIVRSEISERLDAADAYEKWGKAGEAERKRAEARALQTHVV
jgi:uncharacterized protein YqeY